MKLFYQVFFQITVKIQKIMTLQRIAVIIPQFGQCCYNVMYPTDADRMGNSEDPSGAVWFESTLPRPACPKNSHKFPKYSDTQKICCNHSKIWTMWLYHRVMSPNDADGMENSVDPDQTAPLIWVCTVCQDLSVWKIRNITVALRLSPVTFTILLTKTYFLFKIFLQKCIMIIINIIYSKIAIKAHFHKT